MFTGIKALYFLQHALFHWCQTTSYRGIPAACIRRTFIAANLQDTYNVHPAKLLAGLDRRAALMCTMSLQHTFCSYADLLQSYFLGSVQE